MMLAITQREGERFFIGKRIIVKVLRVRGKKVELGIEAPPKVPILREKVQSRIIGVGGSSGRS